MATINPVFAQAVQVLQGLPNQIKQTQQGLANINLGPFRIDVSCSHGFLGIYTEHYTSGVDFGPNYRPVFQNVLNWASTQSGEFDPLYQQLASWFSGTLQKISQAMGELQVVSQKLVGGPPNMVPLIRKDLRDRIPAIIDLLNVSDQQLNNFDQGLGSFLQQLGSYNQSLAQIQAQLEQNMQNVVQDVSAFINSWSCGSGDGYGQLNTWKAIFQASTGIIAANLSNLKHYSDQANACLGQVIGQVTNTLAQFQPVVAQLDQAVDAEISKYMESLHLDVACDLWSSLAAYALNPNA